MPDEATHKPLDRTVASASGQARQVLRARIVLGVGDGLTNDRITVAGRPVQRAEVRARLIPLPAVRPDDEREP